MTINSRSIGSRVSSVFPKTVAGAGGVTVERDGNTVTIGFDYENSELGAELQQAVDSATAQAEAAEASATAAAASETAAETAETNAETAETNAEAAQAAAEVAQAAAEAALAAAEADDFTTNARLANMPAYTLKGRDAGTTGDPSDIDISAVTEKTTLANADIFLIQDSAASNAFKRVVRNNFGGPIFTVLDFYRDAGTALASGITGTTYSAPGAAFTASTFRFDCRSNRILGRKLLEARWIMAWTPGHAANATFVRLTHFESGPTNITQIAEITDVGTTPIVSAVSVTTEIQALIDAGFNGFLGNEHKGNGSEAPEVYSSTLELFWK